VRARGMASRASGLEVQASSFGSNASSASAGTAGHALGHRFPGAVHSEQAAAAEDAVKEMHWQARLARLERRRKELHWQRAPPHPWAAPGAGLTTCARSVQEAQAAKVSLRTRAGGALSDCNDSARSLAAPRHGAQGAEGACRFLYQTQDPWCAQRHGRIHAQIGNCSHCHCMVRTQWTPARQPIVQSI